MEAFLLQATIYLAAAVIAVPLASRLGLGSVLGYLAAGLVIGPLTGLVGAEARDLQHFAEFGVVMMLFLVGLEMEPRALWDMRHRLIGLGGLQIALTTAAVGACALALGLAWPAALAVGMTFSLSSTAIVLQTLNERRLLQTAGGRSAFSVLLAQDIAVIPMLAIIPLLLDRALVPVPSAHGPAAGLSFIESLPGWAAALLTLGAIAGVILGGTYLIRPLFRFTLSAGLRELNTALALLIVVGIASLMALVGLSPALGTFLAGVVLANSEFRHELEADIEPFKALLLGLFFITVGAGFDLELLRDDFAAILALALALIVIKAAILMGLGTLFGLRGRERWLFTLGLAQAGEFGFVLLSFSTQQHVISPALSERLLLVVTMSMLFTPLLFMAHERLARRHADSRSEAAPERIDGRGRVLIAGVGRFGQIVNRLLLANGFRTTVLDKNMETIELLRAFGARAFLGDPTRPELLHKAGLERADVLVVAVDDPEACLKLVRHARRIRPELHIIARARDRLAVFRLYQAGADKIVRELFDSSLRAGRYALEALGLSDYEAARQVLAFFQHDREATRKLAELWDPDIPLHQNSAYIERARQLNAELEARLTAALEEEKPEGKKPEAASAAGAQGGGAADGSTS